MKPFKVAGVCAGVAVLCYVWAMLRGDIVCAGEVTGTLIGCFFLLGIAALVFLVIGFIQKIRA